MEDLVGCKYLFGRLGVLSGVVLRLGGISTRLLLLAIGGGSLRLSLWLLFLGFLSLWLLFLGLGLGLGLSLSLGLSLGLLVLLYLVRDVKVVGFFGG